MPRIETSEAEAIKRINNSLDQVDQLRQSGLADLNAHQQLRNALLQQENKRLTVKYGADYPAVQATTVRLAYNQQVLTGLKAEIDRVGRPISQAPDNSWQIHGRVYDSNNKPIAGANVYFADGNKQWIEKLGRSVTDDGGNYSLTVPNDGLAALIKAEGRLAVSTVGQRVSFLGEVLKPEKDTVQLQDIHLSKQDVVEPPPPPAPGVT